MLFPKQVARLVSLLPVQPDVIWSGLSISSSFTHSPVNALSEIHMVLFETCPLMLTIMLFPPFLNLIFDKLRVELPKLKLKFTIGSDPSEIRTGNVSLNVPFVVVPLTVAFKFVTPVELIEEELPIRVSLESLIPSPSESSIMVYVVKCVTLKMYVLPL